MIETKQQAFDLFEEKRREVLEYSRWVAVKVASKQGHVTIDDVRNHVQLPDGVKPAVFGAVFRDKDVWESIGFTQTKRKTSHGRLVQVYRLKRQPRLREIRPEDVVQESLF